MPGAESPVGAAGIAQFMPATWADISQRMGLPANATVYMPRYAIDAGAFYMHSLRSVWSSPRPARDRHTLALASYNAGTGNLLKAQRVAGGATRACPILSALPRVTGRNAKETQTYVRRIWRYWRRMTVLH
ncbi:transglycosylase SLT domain-containing protein [Salinisphaera sp. SPP-AMP-43]|uniref:transglycosylase SLT domain-containing protein n=1 Tax=Salinisphaera sp. SPP-AMP-43 TaxID=3121288 RepID=UPI003C6E3A0B